MPRYSRFLMFFLCAGVLFLAGAGQAPAVSDFYYANESYTLAEFDSKSDARALVQLMALDTLTREGASLVAQEEAFSALELTPEQQAGVVLSVIEPEVVVEEFTVRDEDVIYSVKVRAFLDSAGVASAASKAMERDPAFPERMTKKYQELETKKEQIIKNRAMLEKAAEGAVSPLRLFQVQLFTPAPQPAAQPQPVAQPAAQVAAKPMFVVAPPDQADPAALRTGMPYSSMLRIAGAPIAEKSCDKKVYFQYPDRWVYFSDGIVRGYINTADWKGPCFPYTTVVLGGTLKYY